MPIPNGLSFDLRDILYKFLLIIGIFIILYAILWIAVELHLIPTILFVLFPQIVMLVIGIFIVYMAISQRRKHY